MFSKANLIRYQNKWNKCQQCPLGATAKRHVLFRSVGSIPTDVLFIGEAPGKVENKLGIPFVGKAGEILSDTLDDKLRIKNYFIANIVCCIPWLDNDPTLDQIRVPSREEADACADHLTELVYLIEPKLVVLMGNIARDLSPSSFSSYERLMLRHPAFITRRGGKDSHEHKLFTNTLQDRLASLGIDHTPFFFPTSYAKEVRSNG